MRTKIVVGLIVLLAIPALGDQVVLKNGDRLTGSIAKSDGKQLVIKTDYAGDVTVKFDAIQSITSAGDLNVSLGGKTVVGPVTTVSIASVALSEAKALGTAGTMHRSFASLKMTIQTRARL